jgi:hypothetical protein
MVWGRSQEAISRQSSAIRKAIRQFVRALCALCGSKLFLKAEA